MSKSPTYDDGKLSATVFRMTIEELRTFCSAAHIRHTLGDTRDHLRDRILKAAGYGSATQAATQIKPQDLTPQEKYTHARAAIRDEIRLLRSTADALESLNNMPTPSPEWLANQAQHEIRYAHSTTHIARLVSMTKRD